MAKHPSPTDVLIKPMGLTDNVLVIWPLGFQSWPNRAGQTGHSQERGVPLGDKNQTFEVKHEKPDHDNRKGSLLCK